MFADSTAMASRLCSALSVFLLFAIGSVNSQSENAAPIPLVSAHDAQEGIVGYDQEGRDGRSLLAHKFPGEAVAKRGHSQGNGHTGYSSRRTTGIIAPRSGSQFRQAEQSLEQTLDVSSDDAPSESVGPNEKCVNKVMMVEETEYTEEIECHHSYDKKCHVTYVTDYQPQQEEDCDTNYKKDCYIEYNTMAFDTPVTICNQKMVRNCDKQGEEVCETVYESECMTSFDEHEVMEDAPECQIMQVEKCRDETKGFRTEEVCEKWPKQVCTLEQKVNKRYSPKTECMKNPREVCGPGPCPLEPAPEECREETKTVTQEVPEETCDLQPERVCKHITKMVPILKAQENCVDVPKEVCSRMRRNPRIIQRPIVKKWCYTPRADEDGDYENVEPTSANFDILEPFASEDDAIETQLPEEEGEMVAESDDVAPRRG